MKSWLELSTSRTTTVMAVAAQNDSMAIGAYREQKETLTRGGLAAPVTAGLAVNTLAATLRNEQHPDEWQQLVPVSVPPLPELRRFSFTMQKKAGVI